jgi:hypothetical protein
MSSPRFPFFARFSPTARLGGLLLLRPARR